MRVFGYARVSTAEQANSGNSLQTQEQQIRGYAMMRGWSLAEVFVDAGISGSVPLAERAEGRRLLATVGEGDTIITAKLDRAFRSAFDALATLEDLKRSRVSLHMIDLGGDVCGNGVGKLVFTILSAVAEAERDRIRERIRDVKRNLSARGAYNGGKRPFGFDVQVDPGRQSKRLHPNQDEQQRLARMQTLRVEGKSYRAIAAEVGLGDPKTVKRILDRASSAGREQAASRKP
ncbi:MAG TPA: recombinase family protein [Pseudolabrys sp.]|nr:recombinase family protein [Pseudolabrys sp.]